MGQGRQDGTGEFLVFYRFLRQNKKETRCGQNKQKI